MKKFFLGLALIAVVLASGCTSAGYSRVMALGSNHKVYVYSGGSLVKTYRSSGRVFSEGESDGWFFQNAETGKLVHVSGTVVIGQE